MGTHPVKIIIGAIGLLCLIAARNSYTTIPVGKIGIVTIFGQPQNNVLTPGIHAVFPLSFIHEINLRVRTTNIESEAASSDLQIVHTSITLNYQIDPLNALNLFLKIGNSEEYLDTNIINPFISETFKTVVARFTAENLINKRDEVSKEISDLLEAKLKAQYLTVSSISVTNFKFSASFNDAIEKKVTAQQQVLTTQNEFQQQKIQNEISVSKAQAEATAIIAKATADAEALKLKKSAITEELLRLNAIEKWNGVLPIYTGSNIPFIMNIKDK